MSSFIFYQNILSDSVATVTASSEASGFDVENVYDNLLSDWWQATAAGTEYVTIDYGSSIAVDSYAVSGHDLSDNAGTIQVQYSTTGIWAGEEVDLEAAHTPADNEPFFRKVSSVSARYWRFKVVTTGSASFIGHLQLGTVLELQRGMRTGMLQPKYADNSKLLTNTTDSGVFTGRSVISKGVRFTITQTMVTTAWVASNWTSLANHMQVKPFIFLFDYDNHPDDVRFVWLDGSSPPKMQYSTPLHVGFSINVRGV